MKDLNQSQSGTGELMDKGSRIVTVSGPFCAGKSTFCSELETRMTEKGFPIRHIINYKMRGPKTLEVPGLDYILIDKPKKFESFVREGKIIVEYSRDNYKYGLSREVLTAIENNRIPLMEMQIDGFVKLRQYLEDNSIKHKLLSFMLHTSKDDAKNRLFERAGKENLSSDDIESIHKHLKGLEDEFELYRIHENLFRYVLKNSTTEEFNKYESIRHLTSRTIEIIDLEAKLNAGTSEDFRAAYVDYVIQKLFNTSSEDLLKSSKKGARLSISDDVIKAYLSLRKNGADPSALKYMRNVVRKNILGASNYYGILSLYIESTDQPLHKRILVDLIGSAVGLSHQYKNPEIHYSRDSRFSLKQLSDMDTSLTDFYISFSPYDPITVPKIDARIHTIAFEGVSQNRPPQIEPVPIEKAIRFLEGNGNH